MTDSLTPGCFGSPGVFSFKSRVCPTCGHFESCRNDVRAALASVPESPSIRVALIEHDRYIYAASVPVDTPVVEVAPKPAASPKAPSMRLKHPRFEITDMQEKIIASLPARAGEELRKLYLRGKDVLIRRALIAGEEPLLEFEGHRSLKLALGMLPTGYSKNQLKCAFVDTLGWSDRSAQSEVSLIWSLLPALKVAIEQRDRLVVAPSLVAENNGVAK